MADRCCWRCGAPQFDDHAKVAAKAAELRGSLTAAGHWISPDGRVSERTAAVVLGKAEGTLANWRRAERPPLKFAIVRRRPTYQLEDLAAFISSSD